MPEKIGSSYKNLEDLSKSIIQQGPTSARLEVAYALLENKIGDVKASVEELISELNAKKNDLGTISAGSRDKVPQGKVNKTVTNIHLLEYYARENADDQSEVDLDIEGLAGETAVKPRCDVSRAKLEELKRTREWKDVLTKYAGFSPPRPVIPHRIKVRSRYYLYSQPYNQPGQDGKQKLFVQKYFKMQVKEQTGKDQALLADNQIIKFFEVKQSTAQQPVGNSCAFLIRKHRLAQLGSEPWLPRGYRFDDVTLLTDARTVRSLYQIYRIAQDRQAIEDVGVEADSRVRFMPENNFIKTSDGASRNRFELDALLSQLAPGKLTAQDFEIDVQALRGRFKVLKQNRDKNNRIRAFDLFIDRDRAKKILSAVGPGNAGSDNGFAGYENWVADWRIRTLLVNLYYAEDIKYVGAEKPALGQGNVVMIHWDSGTDPSDEQLRQWWASYKNLAKSTDDWAMGFLKAQERFFRYTGNGSQPVIKTRSYDRVSWEIKAPAVSDYAVRQNPSAQAAPESMQITLDVNLESFVSRDLQSKISTVLNYPAQLNVIEFKFPVHHLSSLNDAAKRKSQVFERVREFQAKFSGLDVYNESGKQGIGKKGFGDLLWEFPEGPLQEFWSFLNSPEGAACRVASGVLRRGAQDCLMMRLAAAKLLSGYNLYLFDGVLAGKKKVSVLTEGSEPPPIDIRKSEAEVPNYELQLSDRDDAGAASDTESPISSDDD